MSDPELLRSFAEWKRHVTNYSTRDFHKNDDRYNAFAGIENELQHYQKLLYVTGIPVKCLVLGLYQHLDLINKTHQGRTKVCRISTYPLWSQLGQKGSVEFP